MNQPQEEQRYALSQAVIDRVEAEAEKYPSRRAVLKSALRYCQEENGWISNNVVDAVAAYLGLTPIEVYEVATFYDMFYTRPVGRNQIRVCTNISCMLRGAETIMKYLKERLGVEVGGTTEDGRFTLFEAECLSACGTAPMLVCGDRYYEDLTVEKIDQMLSDLD